MLCLVFWILQLRFEISEGQSFFNQSPKQAPESDPDGKIVVEISEKICKCFFEKVSVKFITVTDAMQQHTAHFLNHKVCDQAEF